MFPPFPTSMSVFRGVVLVERALGDRFGWRLLCHARGKCPGSYVPFCHKLRGGGLLRYCPHFNVWSLWIWNVHRGRETSKTCTFSFCQLNLEALFDQLQTLLESVLCPACWKMFHHFFSQLRFLSLQVIWTLLDGSWRRWAFRLWLGFSRHWWGHPYLRP